MIGIDNKFTLYKLSFSNGMFYYELSDAEDYDKLIRRQLSSSQHPVLALNLLYNSMNFMNVTVVAEHIITEFANCLLQAIEEITIEKFLKSARSKLLTRTYCH